MTVMSVVASMLSNEGSADRLRGGNLPDRLLDFFEKCLKASGGELNYSKEL